MDTESLNRELKKRNSETLQALGGFLFLLSVAVLVGTLWAEDAVPIFINIGAGIVLGTIGGIMIWVGRRGP